MKLKVNIKELNNALNIVTRALSSRTTNPIFENILLDANNSKLQLTCSDERVTIITSIPADIFETGRGAINGKSFSELMRKMPDGDIEITMDERFRFIVKSEFMRSRVNSQGQDPELFPLPSAAGSAGTVRLSQKQLKDMINRTEFAIAVDDMREVLTGALLRIKDEKAIMVGLDGYRMAMCTYPLFNCESEMSVIIPGKAVGDIGKLLDDGEESFCHVARENNRLCVTFGETVMYVSLIEGEYINYERLLPKEFKTTVITDTAPLRACIDRAALIARESSNNLVRFEISDGVMHVESNSDITDIHEELEVEKTGDDLKITFNVKYIQDVLRGMESDRIRMNFNSPISPSIMKPDEDACYMHLVLPVRTQA